MRVDSNKSQNSTLANGGRDCLSIIAYNVITRLQGVGCTLRTFSARSDLDEISSDLKEMVLRSESLDPVDKTPSFVELSEFE